MKRIFLLASAVLFGLSVTAQNKNTVSIIPEPVSVLNGNGAFVLKNNTVIELLNGGDSLAGIARQFTDQVFRASGIRLKTSAVAKNAMAKDTTGKH